jgi:hypothetical protein
LMPNDPSRWSNQDYSRTSQVGQSSLGPSPATFM